MKKMKVFFVIVPLLIYDALGVNKQSFTFYEVYPMNQAQARQVRVFGKFCKVIFLDPYYVEGFIEIMKILVPEGIRQFFNDFLICRGVDFTVELDNEILEFFKFENEQRTVEANITFETYTGLNMINSYLEGLSKKYPDIVTLEKYGKSTEGRDLQVVKISSDGGNNTRKPLIFIEAGVHGNEWIGPTQALYIIHQLVEKIENRNLIKWVDWIVFPVVNPDGYEFSLNHLINYRKTRSKGLHCNGVDINRNFDFYWGTQLETANECSVTYRGPMPFSEPEARAIRDVILKNSQRIKLYLSLHSSSQAIMYPWGNTTQPPADVNELKYLTELAARTIEQTTGTRYHTGQISKVLYKTFGDSASWAKGIAGIDLSIAIELPPEEPHTQLSLKCIKFVVLEIFEAVKVIHSYIETKYYGNKIT